MITSVSLKYGWQLEKILKWVDGWALSETIKILSNGLSSYNNIFDVIYYFIMDIL